jgi:3-oxoacyl-[acyl-carrier protein] reductase
MAVMTMLHEKVAIVTGSARGIGLATAQLLAEQGAHVLVSDLDGDAARAAAAGLDGEHAVHVGDITQDGVPEALVQTAIDRWGRLDVVVNNAGYTIDAPAHKMSDDAFRRMLEIHTVAPFRVVRAAAPHLREPAKRERAEGVEVFRKVVNVTSVSGVMGSAGQANYASAKAGVIGLTKTLAKEWGQFKVNCNAVAFGFVDTRLTAGKDPSNTIEVDGETVQLGIPQELRGAIEQVVPLGRSTTPREAAGGILFLCSPWSDYVNGQVLNVTGGLTAGMSA